MPPTQKICPECNAEVWAFQLPAHLYREHGIGDPPRTRSGPSKKAPAAKKRTEKTDPSVPGQSTEAQENAGYENGSNPDTSQYDESAPAPSDSIETAPRKPKLMDRFRARRGRSRGGSAAPVTGERAPRPANRRRVGKRVALDSDISDIWGFMGRRLEGTPHYPTGRMLQYQAPAAGVIIDRAVAGTLPDRIFFQPIARNRDKYEDVGFLLAGPLLTFTITQTGLQMEEAQREGDLERFNELVPKMEMLKEMFAWVARMMLPRLAEGAEKARAKAEKEAEAIKKAFPDLDIGEDPFDVFASMLFTPPVFTEQEASQNGKPDRATSEPHPEGAVPFGD